MSKILNNKYAGKAFLEYIIKLKIEPKAKLKVGLGFSL